MDYGKNLQVLFTKEQLEARIDIIAKKIKFWVKNRLIGGVL